MTSVPYRFLVATYTDSIYTLEFDPTQSPPKLVQTSSVRIGHHPSWITQHPTDPSIVFTAAEEVHGRVYALSVNLEGKAEVVATVASEGADPCTLVASEEELFVGNYSSGTVSVFPISTQDPYISPPSTRHQLTGKGPQADRQESSHPHQVALHDDELLVPDLGSDKTWRFAKNAEGTWTPVAHIPYEAGGGPRHVVIHDGVIYTLLELSNTVTAHTLPSLSSNETPRLLASAFTLSNPPPRPQLSVTESTPEVLSVNDNTPAEREDLPRLAAEILLPPPNATFPDPYVYVSNRNDPHPEGDIVSIFKPLNKSDVASHDESSKLELIAEIRSGLAHLRGMIFFGPDDKYLIAGGANGGGVKIFERVGGGRELHEIVTLQDIKAPTGFLRLAV
ncbi:putative isomerase YbhE [Punctularia strigosozonata HHB-11173 SS5]|uniref:putative isomerase YbhE n=1 Tax=Punctularia strigosozonata (strain HHB-11173) TaxID=741275 RepID=UPI00044174D9|nr:putative isomerase YbhE [Punctularia strigosozonata HHB-11173 SS5]EIN06380.1 putative isomerase YbhE [Punctularia strigosozonata HHB-11173 SS5]